MWKVNKCLFWRVLACTMETCGAHRLAQRYIEKAIATNPDKQELHIQASRLYLKNGQVDRAALHCKKAAIGVGPGGFFYWLDKASNGFYLTENNGRTECEHQIKDEKLINQKDKAAVLNNSGILLLKQKRYQEALTCFEQALKSAGKKDPAVFTNIGLAYTKMGFHSKALDYYQQAQNSGFFTLELIIHKGYSLFHLKKYEEALTCYELARQMAPNDNAVLSNLGSCYQALGKYNEAIDCFKIAVSAAPEDAALFNNLALCYEKIGNNDEAHKFYQRAVKLAGDDVIIIINYAAFLGKLGQLENALELCEQALNIAPHNHEAWGVKGNLLMDTGNTEEAAKAFAKALGLTG